MPNTAQTIYLVTNRNLIDARDGKMCFGKTFHKNGPHELRLAKITGLPSNRNPIPLPGSTGFLARSRAPTRNSH